MNNDLITQVKAFLLKHENFPDANTSIAHFPQAYGFLKELVEKYDFDDHLTPEEREKYNEHHRYINELIDSGEYKIELLRQKLSKEKWNDQ